MQCPDGFYKPSFSVDIACDQCPFREKTNGTQGNVAKSACTCEVGYYDIRRPFDPTVAPFVQGVLSPDEDIELAICNENSWNDGRALDYFSFEELTKFRCHLCPEDCADCPGAEEMGVKQFYWTMDAAIPEEYGPTPGPPVLDSFDRQTSNHTLYNSELLSSPLRPLPLKTGAQSAISQPVLRL